MPENTKLKKNKISNQKCSQCGSNLVYDISQKCLKCDHCGSVFKVEHKYGVNKLPFENISDSFKDWNNETKLMRCSNCGAQNVYSKFDNSNICAYCGGSLLEESGDNLPGLKPTGIIPFSIPKEEIEKIFFKWISKKIFAPFKMQKKLEIKNIFASYCPTFAYDTDVSSNFKGVLYKNIQYEGKTEQRQFVVSGSRKDNFSNIFISVGENIDSINFERIKPFDFSHVCVYNSDFLFGIHSSHYRMGAYSAFESAKEIMKAEICQYIVNKYDADGMYSLNIDANYTNTQYAYILTPIWINKYDYNKKTYNFYINGDNGNISGKTPKSKIKISIYLTLTFIIAGLLCWKASIIAGIIVGVILLFIMIGLLRD